MPAPPETAPLALGGAPEGDPYVLPTLMAELTLREMTWRTLNLGANVPTPRSAPPSSATGRAWCGCP